MGDSKPRDTAHSILNRLPRPFSREDLNVEGHYYCYEIGRWRVTPFPKGLARAIETTLFVPVLCSFARFHPPFPEPD